MHKERTSRIDGGRAWTEDDIALVTDMANEEREKAMAWIHENILPRKSPLLARSSYGIKHLLERDTGIYMTNNQFKDAMLLCGFEPVDERRLNWNYRISEKSPAFRRKAW